jgi:hypothetical protein
LTSKRRHRARVAPRPVPARHALKQRDVVRSERMWPLDVLLTALAGLVLFIVVTQLRFDDPRWLYNGWTYVIAVPLVALVLDISLRNIASRYVKRSIQLGMLFSLFVHLLLLLLAVNIVIFSKYFPEAFTGVKRERSPIRKTVPEYLFETPQQTVRVPDWSQPVETETASPVIPKEERRIPPVQRSAAELEMPRPKDLEPKVLEEFLVPRQEPEVSKPRPADSPSKLARRSVASSEMMEATMSEPVAPSLQAEPNPSSDLASVERSESVTRRESIAPAMPSPSILNTPEVSSTSRAAASRVTSELLPKVGDIASNPEKRTRTTQSAIQPAGAAPAPPTVAIAKAETSERLLSPVTLPNQRQQATSGAQLSMSETAGALSQITSSEPSPTGAESRNSELGEAGLPAISEGDAMRAPAKVARSAPGEINDASAAGSLLDGRIDDLDRSLREPQRSGASTSPAMNQGIVGASPMLDLMLRESTAGLADRPDPNVGIVPSPEQPDIAALDISRETRPRREVGGPTAPAGTKIAAVESFNRRVMRTSGGAAPTPAGMVGPATEEAIELGLAYLARIQNKDGSWSLQGHGDEVLLRSDTAATGLCLLAYQGAGYTHRQHQYAATVAKGLQFLIDNQKTNGDLYRSENEISDRNVAFYSHGIASLAMCEAYGMTQDAELREAAQMAINYIVETQHHQRGGWRYTSQVSSDTSVTGWMMMAIKSGELSGLEVPKETYDGIDRWLELAKQAPGREDRYRYNPYAPDTAAQRHGRMVTPTMTAVGMLMRMYSGWRRDHEAMKSAAEYLLEFPPQLGTTRSPQRDAYYWYYATQVMFHMGGEYWENWNRYLNPMLLSGQIKHGPESGSWDPELPVPDRWSPHGGRMYVTTMNLLNLEVYYRHLPIYEDTAQ